VLHNVQGYSTHCLLGDSSRACWFFHDGMYRHEFFAGKASLSYEKHATQI
jgi:hypothetical protein